MKGSNDQQAREIKELIARNFLHPDTNNEFTGNKFFGDSDLTIHRTPHWMASVRMASDRVIGTELVNEDNLKGYYMADGAIYTYIRGDEYHNIFSFLGLAADTRYYNLRKVTLLFQQKAERIHAIKPIS